MARINLLPWREELRKEKEKNFYIGLGTAVTLGCALVFGISLQIDAMILAQKSRNNYLDTEIKKVERAITEIQELQKKKTALLERMKVIQKFQSTRSDSVRLLDEIVKVLPEGVHLTSYSQKNKNQEFLGVAQSNARVSAFMRNLDRSEWLKQPKLKFIKAKGKEKGDKVKYSEFTLNAEQIISEVSEDNK